MDFYTVLEEIEEGQAYLPYASLRGGMWTEGLISIDHLNSKYSQYSTAEEMINATESEGLKLYFDWLKEKGILN